MKRNLLALLLILGEHVLPAQQITLMPDRESQLNFVGWTAGGYVDRIKVAVPGANFQVDTTWPYQNAPVVTFGEVDSRPLYYYPMMGFGRLNIYQSHPALPYNYVRGFSYDSSQQPYTYGLDAMVIHPDTLAVSHWGFSPMIGTHDLEIRYQGRRWVKDSAFTFDGIKEPTIQWAYNRNAGRIQMHGLEGRAGQTLDVEITGTNTTFTQASPSMAAQGFAPNQLIVNFYNDSSFNTVNGVTVISPTRMIASITVPPGTAPGLYDVVLVTPQDGFKHINNGFRVLAGASSHPGHLRGVLFADSNRNCRRDPGEKALDGVAVEANPGRFVAITDSLGRYDIPVPFGAYTVNRNARRGWQPSCRPYGWPQVMVSGSRPIMDSLDFADFQVIYRDVALYAASGFARPGFSLNYYAHVTNPGHRDEQRVLRMVRDTVLDYVTSTPAPDQVRGDTLFWNVSVPKGQHKYFTIETKLPADVSLLGQTLHSRFDLLGGADSTPANDTTTVANEVRGSFDPNDKSVEPEGNLTVEDSVLTYLIRFQNTGTDTAFTVVVRDSISQHLNLGSLRTLVASHNFTYKVQEGRQAEWRFDNILLVDSNRNEERSHGFIKFAISREKGSAIGSLISNRAYIHFDFNPPVATNLVQNTLVSVRKPKEARQRFAGKAEVIPNPISGKARVVLLQTSARNAVLEIRDALGRVAYTQAGLSGREFSFDAGLKPGVYSIRITDGGAALAHGRFVAE